MWENQGSKSKWTGLDLEAQTGKGTYFFESFGTLWNEGILPAQWMYMPYFRALLPLHLGFAVFTECVER